MDSLVKVVDFWFFDQQNGWNPIKCKPKKQNSEINAATATTPKQRKKGNNNNWEKWIKNKSSIDIVPHNRIARNLKIVYFLNTFTRYRCVWCYTLWLRDSSGIFKCAAKHLVRIQFSWFALRADLLEEYTVIIDTSQLIKIATDIHAHNRHTMEMTRDLQHNHNTMW